MAQPPRKQTSLQDMWNRQAAAKKRKTDDEDSLVQCSETSDNSMNFGCIAASQSDVHSTLELDNNENTLSSTPESDSDSDQSDADISMLCHQENDDQWPKIWTEQQIKTFREKYP